MHRNLDLVFIQNSLDERFQAVALGGGDPDILYQHFQINGYSDRNDRLRSACNLLLERFVITPYCEGAQNIYALMKQLEREADRPPTAETLLTELNSKFESKSVHTRIMNEFMDRFVPHFVYFSDYSTMGGRIAIQDLKDRQEAEELEESDLTFLSLLELVGSDLDDLQNESSYEEQRALLEGASNSISDEVFKFWSQNKQLAVELSLSNANPEDPAPMNEGTILNIRIRNHRHRVTVPFDDRSRGFVWFFSFLAYFSGLESDSRDLVLLLDEPGLSLHAKAQNDFLTFIDDRLAPRHQVIYSTHSPFLIDAKKIERVRTVQDDDDLGTIVSGDFLRTDKDTVFPLQAALGYDLTQSLFIGPDNLLVEGPSDILYLQLLNRAVRSRQMGGLDERWTIIPVGGADKIATFVSLLGGNHLDVCVLMDANNSDIQRIQSLQSNHLLTEDSLVLISEFTGTSSADMEDMFDPTFYLGLVNGAYAPVIGRKISSKELTTPGTRIVRKLEAVLAGESAADGKFDHFQPSLYFLNNQTKLLKALDDETIARFATLFERVNSQLTSSVP